MVVDWLRRPPAIPPLVIAHRGSSGVAPENTRASFELAVAQGARAVECDVVMTADGVAVVIHDTTLDRTTTGSGNVSDRSWADLSLLDAGTWKDARYASERLPRLVDLLGAACGRARLVIELKAGDPTTLAHATRDAIGAHPGVEVAIISFVPEVVAAARAAMPEVAVGYLYAAGQPFAHDDARAIAIGRDLGAHFLSPQASLVTADLCRAAHDAGLPVSTWTANDPDLMRRLAAGGVDAITTDWPDRALATLGAR